MRINRKLLSIERGKQLVPVEQPRPFQLVVRHRPNPHKISLTADWGSTPGPWAAVGVNDTVWAAGYLPSKSKRKNKQAGVAITPAVANKELA